MAEGEAAYDAVRDTLGVSVSFKAYDAETGGGVGEENSRRPRGEVSVGLPGERHDSDSGRLG